MEECEESSDCPSGWVCPDGDATGIGKIGFICTPKCELDRDCTDRTDVATVRSRPRHSRATATSTEAIG
jgi:hypothetical protein